MDNEHMRSVEERIVARCETIGAKVPRNSLYSHFSDDFEDEGAFAKCLGRLVADGRLARDKRKRPDSTEEFVYGAPATLAASVRAGFASVVAEVKKAAGQFTETTRDGALTFVSAPTEIVPAKPEPARKEIPMSKTSQKRQMFVDHLNATRAWQSPGDIAKALKQPANKASYHLNAGAEVGALQALGSGKGRRFAALGVAKPGADDRPPAETSAKTARAARTDVPPSPERMQLVPLPLPGEPMDEVDVRCAIEDTGLFAINDGKSTIRLTPKNIDKVIHFLTMTQHVWKRAA